MNYQKLEELFKNRSKGLNEAKKALDEFMKYIGTDLSKKDSFFILKRASYLVYFLAAYFREKIDSIDVPIEKILSFLRKTGSYKHESDLFYCQILCQTAVARSKPSKEGRACFRQKDLVRKITSNSYYIRELNSEESYLVYSLGAQLTNGTIEFDEGGAWLPTITNLRNARYTTEKAYSLVGSTPYLYEASFLKAFLLLLEAKEKGEKSMISNSLDVLISAINDIELNREIGLEDPFYKIENDYYKEKLLLLYEEIKKLIVSVNWRADFQVMRFRLLKG